MTNNIKRKPAVIFPDDTFIVSYPRSGNAWIRLLVAMMQDPHRDLESKKLADYLPDIYTAGDQLANFERPRIMKSHQTYDERYPRVLYLLRDGRDVAVSYHDLLKKTRGYIGSLADFLLDFLSGSGLPFGSWQDHVRSWLLPKHTIPFLCVKYEELHEEPVATLQRVAGFLGLAVDNVRIEQAIEQSTFQKYKEIIKKHDPNQKRGYQGGVKGAPGAWKDVFTKEMADLFWGQTGELMNHLGYVESVD